MVQTWQKVAGLVTRQVAGETLIIPLMSRLESGDSIYRLNEVGLFIWRHLDGRQSVEQIALSLSSEYDTSLEEATQDTLDFCTALHSIGLLCLVSVHE